MKPIDEKVIEVLNREKKVTLGFSGGKDSLACAVVLQKLGIEFIPFFFYHVPDLKFVEDNLKMYEDLLKIEIIRAPHPMLYDYIRHQDFQTPKGIMYLDSLKFVKAHFEDMMDIYLYDKGDDRHYYDVVGVRASESLNRRLVFKKQGFINETKKQISLIADWTNKDVFAFLQEEQIPLTNDYKIWGRSFDGLKYQFLFGVKKNYPNDWEHIKSYFPLIELELFRYEQNKKYYEI